LEEANPTSSHWIRTTSRGPWTFFCSQQAAHIETEQAYSTVAASAQFHIGEQAVRLTAFGAPLREQKNTDYTMAASHWTDVWFRPQKLAAQTLPGAIQHNSIATTHLSLRIISPSTLRTRRVTLTPANSVTAPRAIKRRRRAEFHQAQAYQATICTRTAN
jgi:hypothetical protein